MQDMVHLFEGKPQKVTHRQFGVEEKQDDVLKNLKSAVQIINGIPDILAGYAPGIGKIKTDPEITEQCFHIPEKIMEVLLKHQTQKK